MKFASRGFKTRSRIGAISKSLQIDQEGEEASAFPSSLKQQRAPQIRVGESKQRSERS